MGDACIGDACMGDACMVTLVHVEAEPNLAPARGGGGGGGQMKLRGGAPTKLPWATKKSMPLGLGWIIAPTPKNGRCEKTA
jgi:hypothetical protein